jgi:hypothetical protein
VHPSAPRREDNIRGHAGANAMRGIVDAYFHAKDLVDTLLDGLHIAGKKFSLLIDLLYRAVERLFGK